MLKRLYKYKFTVFTPTFNRANTLERVFNSLVSQTFRDFEWIVVDDGSTDNTKKLIERWKKEADFTIRYFYQENKGKHIAFNIGVKLANGELFVPADSDDVFTPEALERFLYHWNNVPADKRNNFSGVTCLCQDENGNIIGDKFPKDIMDSNGLEMSHKYKIKGEKWGFYRTDVLRNFPFPDISNVGYIPESLVWHAITTKYKKRFVNDVLRIYFKGPDQIMLQTKKKPSKYAFGRQLYHRENLNKYIFWAKYDPLGFLKSAVNYVRFSLHLGIGFRKQLNDLANWKAKLLYIIALPMGWLVYLREKKK